MSRYYNDHFEFALTVDQARNYFQYFVGDAYTSCLRLDDSRSHMGPYRIKDGKGWVAEKINLVLNRLLWRQHVFNQQMLWGMQKALLEQAEVSLRTKKRPLLGVLVPYDVAENITGGSSRLWGLCEALAANYRVELWTVTRWWKAPERRKIYPGVDLLSFPMSAEVEAEITKNTDRFGQASPFLSMGAVSASFPLLDNYLRKVGPECTAVIMDSPYLFDRLRMACPSVPMIYETPNVNIEYLSRMAAEKRETALPVLREMEARAIADSLFIMSVSDYDITQIVSHYPIAGKKIHLVPNGVSIAHSYCAFPSESIHLSNGFGFKHPAVLFVGSVLAANLHAMTLIIEKYAIAFSNVLWVIVGVTDQEYFRCAGKRLLPANVVFTGRVSEKEKEAVMALCRLSIAPLAQGTGSSLKLPDYIAHGKPVITTDIGLRGFAHLSDTVDLVELDHFIPAIKKRLDELDKNPNALDDQARAALRSVKDTLDWPIIASKLHDLMKSKNLLV